MGSDCPLIFTWIPAVSAANCLDGHWKRLHQLQQFAVQRPGHPRRWIAPTPILPYTTAETMDSGWAWQIEHEHLINRGYVYSSSMLSDDQARAEFQSKNPRARIADRVVKFRTGRYRRCWVGNVMAIGNSSGFVEPLESTSLMVVCWQCQTAVEFHGVVGQTPTLRNLFSQTWANTWDEIPDFLALQFVPQYPLGYALLAPLPGRHQH